MNQKPNINEDEIDLREIFFKIAQGKRTVFGVTLVSILLSLLYVSTLKPTYEAQISFLSPSEESIIQAKKFSPSVTKESLYQSFINTFTSKDFQQKVFNEKEYLTKLNTENIEITNPEEHFLKFADTLSIQDEKEKKGVLKITYEHPVNISMKGGNPTIIADFLNDVSHLANKMVVDNFISTQKLSLVNRINEIDKQKSLLLLKVKKDRMAQIDRIKEANQQKTNEINDEINRLRVKAKKDRLNRIQTLSDAAKIAGELGIQNNNFKKISDKQNSNSTLTVAIGDNQKLPKWYMYGELALLEEVKLLKNRTNDDPYVPKIVELQNQLDAINKDQKLKTLEDRVDDSPFVAEIAKLEVEKSKLESTVFDDTGISAARISQHAIAPTTPIKSKKKLIVSLATAVGLMFGILWVLISGAFRNDRR